MLGNDKKRWPERQREVESGNGGLRGNEGDEG